MKLSASIVIVSAVLVGLLVASFLGFKYAWDLGSGTPMSIHGWIAMGLAGVLVTALGGGLMALAFYSARHGYDDEQGTDGEQSVQDDDRP